MKIYLTNTLKMFSCGTTYSQHIEPIVGTIMMISLSAVSEFFKNRALAKLLNKHSHSWCYLHRKILSSIPAHRNLSFDLVYKINWLVSISDIFHESLMHNSYSWRQFSQLLQQHPSPYFALFFKEFGWTILSNQQPFHLAVFFFPYSNFPASMFWKHLIQCVSDITMSTIGLKSRKLSLYLLIVRKCNHGKQIRSFFQKNVEFMYKNTRSMKNLQRNPLFQFLIFTWDCWN